MVVHRMIERAKCDANAPQMPVPDQGHRMKKKSRVAPFSSRREPL